MRTLHHICLKNADYVQPIKEAQMEPPVRDIVTAIGWGMVADDLPGNVDNLREVDVPVLSDTVAEEIYAGIDFTTKVQMRTNLL